MELDQEYNVICVFDVLEHIEDDRMAIQWIYEHVAPGGVVFLRAGLPVFVVEAR